LDEAFGFAIGARSVRACEEVAQTMALTSGTEVMGAITRAVIAHETLRFNAQGSKVGQSALQEKDRTLVVLLRHDLGKSEPRSIVNTDMDIFPTGAAHRVTPVESHAVAWMDDLGQLFNIKVEQLAGKLALVAHHRRRRLEGTQASETMPAQEPRNRGAGEAALAGDLEAWETHLA